MNHYLIYHPVDCIFLRTITTSGTNWFRQETAGDKNRSFGQRARPSAGPPAGFPDSFVCVRVWWRGVSHRGRGESPGPLFVRQLT